MAAAWARAKRDPAEVTLIAVTKTAAPEQVREILSLGVAALGESGVKTLQRRGARVTELFARQQKMGDTGQAPPPKVRWHMIGHLQRNKVKPILPIVGMIQTIDSL